MEEHRQTDPPGRSFATPEKQPQLDRRKFLSLATAASAGVALTGLSARAQHGAGPSGELPVGGTLPKNEPGAHSRYRPPFRFGLGGGPLATVFEPLTAGQSHEIMEKAWDAGTRFFDTSPWYGLGLGERRMGHFLDDKDREDFVISTKIGRVLTPTDEPPRTPWRVSVPFNFEFDFSAEGTRKSIEQSMHRMGMSHFEIVLIHDLCPSHMGDGWVDRFKEAAEGAIPVLTEMREEGKIKAWGFGVNSVDPCLRALEEADPDLFLLAMQYSIVDHETPLQELFPACAERDVSIIAGTPLATGFLAGKERYNYSSDIPDHIRKKGSRIGKIASEYGTDLRTAALQFCNAPSVVNSIVPGASSGQQVIENALSMATKLPSEFWLKLREEELIHPDAQAPA